MTLRYFNESTFKNIENTKVKTHTGVTCGFYENVFTESAIEKLRATFPNKSSFKLVDKNDSGGGHKRFYVGPEYVITRNFGSAYHLRSLPKPWRDLMTEFSSPDFIQKLSKAIGVEFNTLCNFGIAYGDEGCMQEPHLDGAIREGDSSWFKANVALLLYLNENPDPVSATEIYDTDRKTILLKGTTMSNSLLFFVQHPNAWHGFPRVPEGHTRKLISLTYGNAPQAVGITWSLCGHLLAQLKLLAKKFQ